MATEKNTGKTAKKRTDSTGKNPARGKAVPSRRKDAEREAAARRIYADEESILKADAADESMDMTRTRMTVYEDEGTKTKQAAASRTEGKEKNLKPGKTESARAESAKGRRSGKTESARAESAKGRRSGKTESARAESAKGRRSGKTESARAESAKGRKSGKTESARAESAKSRRSGRTETSRTESAKGRRPGKTESARAESGKSRESGKSEPVRAESGKSLKSGKGEPVRAESMKPCEKAGKETSEKRKAGALSGNAGSETLKKDRMRSESSKETGKSGTGAGTGKKGTGKSAKTKKQSGKAVKTDSVKKTAAEPALKKAAAQKPQKRPSGNALIRELRQAVHFDKKVFVGVLCAIVIVSIVLINITELEKISHQPLTDVSAGHNALANQMSKDLTEKTQAITAIEEAERAAAEEAERAAMDAEAYEAQLAAEKAAYDAAHGDENDLFNTMEVRDPEELRVTLAENNAYAIGDSMIEGMNDGQYVNTENLIFRRGCGTYDSRDLFERAINLQASVVWVQLGLNDMDMYNSDVGQYKENYRELVLYLQENLPNCRIFLCNINPISENACRRHPQYEYADVYNQAIMELCEELGVTYVDNTTLVLGHPELWDTDGIHPVQDVYLWMLSHMCYEAGI